MKVGPSRIWGTLLAAWRAAWAVPGKHKCWFILKPMDATRYLEFSYLLEFMDRENIPIGTVLDVSSPVMISHILARKGCVVTKTDLNPAEAKFVGGSRNLSFEVQDARHLPYGEGSFDLVVSISVIEHIYGDYAAAIAEMVRVTRPGGYVYLTFPVSGRHDEEWVAVDIYGGQYRDGENVFFQYRFGPDDYRALVEGLPDNVELAEADIFWERKDGLYDTLVGRLRGKWRWAVADHVRASILNLVAGPRFFLRDPGDFAGSRRFGNAHWVLRVKGGG